MKKSSPKEVVEQFQSLDIDQAIDAYAIISDTMQNSLIGQMELTEKRACFLKETRDKFFRK